ncbi:MAG: cupin domain-containing protein [Acidobacteriota bacterium]|nr:cupin domain-containing protein [Acidobacteriota bacterium]
MKKSLFPISLVLLVICSVGALSAHEQKKGAAKKMPAHVMVTPGDIRWVDAPPSMPPGAKVAVLEGDPSKPEYFAMRIKAPGGYKFMPHWHPNVERFTVLSGTFHLGLGDTFTETGAQAMTAGSYATLQPKVHHYGWTEGETELHLTTLGPWKRVYVNPADDPSKKK